MADTKSQNPQEQPVTQIVKRTVKPGREAEYEEWVKGATEDLKKFPGYRDITMIRPQPGPKSKEYVLIIHFDNYKSITEWEASPIRTKWMERAKDLTEQVSSQKITGLEYWFALPEIPKSAVPPRPKMIAVTVCGIFPLSIVVNYLFSFLPLPIPPLLRGLLISIVMVSTMTYLVMPNLTRLFKPWLFPAKS